MTEGGDAHDTGTLNEDDWEINVIERWGNRVKMQGPG